MAYSTLGVVRKTSPASRPVEPIGLGARFGVDFETFDASLRRALGRVSPLEAVVADRLVLAAWRLHLASAAEFESALDGDGPIPDSRDALDAEARLAQALELLESSRAARLGLDDEPDDNPFEPTDELGEADFSNEWPTLPDEDSPVAPRWQDRLVFDFNVSETSPVVKGTWVTVGHVVSLIVDGWTWADVLRTHPELTEDDVRTCLAYTVDHDDVAGA